MGYNLLSCMKTNAKTAKSLKNYGVRGAILYLAPSTNSGVNVCPAASKGCAAACLFTAGRGRFDSVKNARMRRTRLLIDNRLEFMRQLKLDLDRLERLAKRDGLKAVCRLNGTSDLNWIHIIKQYPNIEFYDYTKVLSRALFVSKNEALPNYDITFSESESNRDSCEVALKHGIRVATVFKNEIPTIYHNRPVFEGDSSDLRLIDPKGCVIALKAKGDAKRDTSGFVKYVS